MANTREIINFIMNMVRSLMKAIRLPGIVIQLLCHMVSGGRMSHTTYSLYIYLHFLKVWSKFCNLWFVGDGHCKEKDKDILKMRGSNWWETLYLLEHFKHDHYTHKKLYMLMKIWNDKLWIKDRELLWCINTRPRHIELLKASATLCN